MSSGLYGSDEFETLLHEEDVLDGAFECLRRIWADPDALGDRRLTESEYQTRLLERELEKVYPPLYDDLREQMGGHPITELNDGCGVIMDALSLREGFRLEQELADEHDWSVSLSWAPIERLPSETQFIGDLDVPKLPGTSPEYVWTRHPDQRLEGALKGNYSMEEVEDIYEDVKALLEDIVHESGHDEFLVTSDHGYVNHLGNSPYSLTDEQEEALSSKFTSRFKEVANGQAYQLLERAKVIERVREHYLVRGHYKWTKRGATKKIMHGGFSLPECMTPVLRIQTER